MWTLIIIIVVVVVGDDDTYYWVYLSSDHLFQVYYKVRQVLLQSATAFFNTKCDGLLLQSATGITKCDNFITKCDRYYKVRRLLQSATVHTFWCLVLYIYRTRPRASRKGPLGIKVNKITGCFAAITLKHKDFTREYLPRPPVVIIWVQLQ